ncbi:MAG: DUF309 domain-containing protein, partial [Anaerolineales bacterium]
MPDYPHRAIGLIADDALRAQIETLLPDYTFAWGLALKGAIHKAADWRPSFLLVDIEAPQDNWRDVIIALQSNPATRRIPMLGIASAQNKETRRTTAALSINGPLPRDLLPERLPDWVARRARRWDADYYAALEAGCAGDLPDLAQEGIRLFNERDFWEAHEVLEHAWIAVRPDPIG